MRIGTKLLLAALFTIAAVVVVALLVGKNVITNQGVNMAQAQMRSILLGAENVRNSIASLNDKKSFDTQKLIAELKTYKDFREAPIYSTIPVVAGWKSVQEVAAKEGLKFRVVKNQARNPANEPNEYEAKILSRLEQGDKEYFKVDTEHGLVVYARPIFLTTDCLFCHGDPKTSLTGDGKDLLGFAMENWKAGEVHGAYILSSPLEKVNKVVRASVGETLAWILPLSAIVALMFYLLTKVQLVAPLEQAMQVIDGSSKETSSASGEIATASHSLADNCSQQAAAIEETSAALEEISSMTKINADNAASAEKAAQKIEGNASEGFGKMTELTQAMRNIADSSAEISKIVENIDQIAFQTNILALNAAVEAARAGEAGAGFAVVADEVRRLAMRSAVAAKETAEKINSGVERTRNGSQLCEDMQAQFGSIVEGAKGMHHLVSQVATSSKEQSNGIVQISGAIQNLDKSTQSIAACSEEAAASSGTLNEQAVQLGKSVDLLAEIVNGKKAVKKEARRDVKEA